MYCLNKKVLERSEMRKHRKKIIEISCHFKENEGQKCRHEVQRWFTDNVTLKTGTCDGEYM